ncbi:MAG: hypothetical protein H8E76_10185 [Helicobacteraceae bacterium]|nr:hypothetical protein [Candidatus Sulfurimonas ponti]
MRKNKRKSVIPKDKKIDFTPMNEVKKMFKDWFRRNKNVTQIMTKEDVVRNILTKLDAKQNDALEDAMNKLKKEGFMEVKEDGLTLVLTKLGADSL